MRKTAYFFLAIALLSVILVANLIAEGSATNPGTKSAPTFKSISIILNSNCAQCHGSSISKYPSIMQVVVPGNPKASQLYYDVSTGRMPRGRDRLGSDQIKEIYDWIAAGALNN
jgi:hypothetical protein